LVKTELHTKRDRSKLADLNLLEKLRSSVSGIQVKLLADKIGKGQVDEGLGDSVAGYLAIVDSPTGKFSNASVEEAHQAFVAALSRVQSLTQGQHALEDESKRSQFIAAAQEASSAHKRFRELARVELGG
jgi:hypothetical protein